MSQAGKKRIENTHWLYSSMSYKKQTKYLLLKSMYQQSILHMGMREIYLVWKSDCNPCSNILTPKTTKKSIFPPTVPCYNIHGNPITLITTNQTKSIRAANSKSFFEINLFTFDEDKTNAIFIGELYEQYIAYSNPWITDVVTYIIPQCTIVFFFVKTIETIFRFQSANLITTSIYAIVPTPANSRSNSQPI